MGFFGGGASASNMVGATSSVAGTAGLVPQPAAGDEHKILRGDATFAGVPYTQKQNTNITGRAIVRFDNFSFNTFGVSGSYSFWNDRMMFLPVYVPSTLTSYNINLSCPANANATRNVKVGIYDFSTSTGLPSSRVAVSAQFNTACTSDTEFATAFTTTLTQGIYFLGFSTATNASFYGYNNTGYGLLIGIFANYITNAMRLNTTYGINDFPSSITASNIIMENSQVPRMYITGL